MRVFKNRLLKSFKGKGGSKDDADVNYSLLNQPQGNILRSTDFLSSLDLLCEGEIGGFVNPAGHFVEGIDVLQAVYLDDIPVLELEAFSPPEVVARPDTTPLVITIIGNNPEVVVLGTTYTDAGATSNGPEVVSAISTVNTSTVGVYTVTYSATNSDGDTTTAIRSVRVTSPPVITIIGNNPETVEFRSTYTDAGATSNGPEVVSAISTVNTSTVGVYTVTYSATNSDGLTGTATRVVNVVDSTNPVITIVGDNPLYLVIGGTYLEAGATSDDGVVTQSGTVNMSVEGTYFITYSATDSSGNIGTATRTVEVTGNGLALFAFGHPYVNGDFYEYQPSYNRWKGTPTDGSSYRIYIYKQDLHLSARWVISVGTESTVGQARYYSTSFQSGPGYSNSPVNLDWSIANMSYFYDNGTSEWATAPGRDITSTLAQTQIGFVIKSSQYSHGHVITELVSSSYAATNLVGAYTFGASFQNTYSGLTANGDYQTINLGSEERSIYGRIGADGSAFDSQTWRVLQLVQSSKTTNSTATRNSEWQWKLFNIKRRNNQGDEIKVNTSVSTNTYKVTFESPILNYPDDINQILDPTGVQLAEVRAGSPNYTLEINAANTALTFTLNGSGTEYSVTDCLSSTSGTLIIPRTYDGLPVTSIGYQAIADCFSLTNVIIPNSVTSIGDQAFAFCTGMTSITIGNGVTSIGALAFQRCDSLSTINSLATSAPEIGTNVFQNVLASSINIPNGAAASYRAEGNGTTYGGLILNSIL
jgi:hypothetical protein